MLSVIHIKNDWPEPEQSYIPPKTYHGQPRSIRETRRAQRRGRR